ncbi:unnamed protein product [Phyllotreta striolata]|uniref:Transmembrane protein n=1 Tax=Phyllotreta striolata TaxID=444603 RepID=A0A9N9TKH3_PHYSR|nr:unnamed protein product [Phyllotreta striolata]
MSLTSAQKLVCKISSVLGGLQGLVWTGLSLACIVVYYSDHQPDEDPTTFSKLLNLLIYSLYLNKETSNAISESITRTIRAQDFAVIMWIYFFLSVGILATSIDLLFAVRSKKNRKSKSMIFWGVLTGCISLIDVVFTSLLLRDFTNCPINSLECRLAVGVVMTISARGFTLLFVNGFLSYKMIKIGIQVETLAIIKNSPYDVNIPRVKIPTEGNMSSFGRSVSQQNEYNDRPSAPDRRYVY